MLAMPKKIKGFTRDGDDVEGYAMILDVGVESCWSQILTIGVLQLTDIDFWCTPELTDIDFFHTLIKEYRFFGATSLMIDIGAPWLTELAPRFLIIIPMANPKNKQ